MRMCALLDSAASEREVSVTRLARQLGLSMRQLRHRFSEKLGINPSRLFALAPLAPGDRVDRTRRDADRGSAGRWLRRRRHFSRVFQAQFGMAPSQAVSSIHFAGALAPGV